MKAIRIVCSTALLMLLLLSACGRSEPVQREPITLFPPHSETQMDSFTQPSKDDGQTAEYTRAASANDTYGETKVFASVGKAKDVSLTYRTADSYTFEEVALQAAKAQFGKTLRSPDSLTVSNTQLMDCADDGDCVYYRVYMDAAYRVETGEQITRGVFQSVGVRKKDRATFDAGQQMRTVLENYSAFAAVLRGTRVRTDSPDFVQAAQEIAIQQLKEPSSGRVLHCRRNDAFSERFACEAYDVECEGVNSYGLRVPSVYSVYMVYEDGYIRQFDPYA